MNATSDTNPSAPHSAHLRLHRLMDASATFFVTKSLQPKTPVLTTELRAIITGAFRHATANSKALCGAFVVMPDHWHALVAPLNNETLPVFMRNLMGFVGAKTTKFLVPHGCVWQESYYESRIQSTKQLIYVRDYIELNPVRKKLVLEPTQWDASSAAHPEITTQPWPWDFPGDHKS